MLLKVEEPPLTPAIELTPIIDMVFLLLIEIRLLRPVGGKIELVAG